MSKRVLAQVLLGAAALRGKGKTQTIVKYFLARSEGDSKRFLGQGLWKIQILENSNSDGESRKSATEKQKCFPKL